MTPIRSGGLELLSVGREREPCRALTALAVHLAGLQPLAARSVSIALATLGLGLL
jgi:hypothetical protein